MQYCNFLKSIHSALGTHNQGPHRGCILAERPDGLKGGRDLVYRSPRCVCRRFEKETSLVDYLFLVRKDAFHNAERHIFNSFIDHRVMYSGTFLNVSYIIFDFSLSYKL